MVQEFDGKYDLVVDAVNLKCPEPVMLLHKGIRSIESGQVLKIIATDPSTTRDIPSFCNHLNHELISQCTADERYIYILRKK